MNELRKTLTDRLGALGIEPNRLLGQHFLVDAGVVNKIVEAASIDLPALVVEIGAGPGQLTERLLQTGAAVKAIEKDTRFADLFLPLKEAYPSFQLIQKDARNLSFADLVEGERQVHVVGNLPYYITTDLIEKSLLELPQASSQTFLIQTEAARRLVSPPGTKAYGALNVFLRRYGSPSLAFRVPAGAFMPPPHVASSLLVIKRQHRLTSSHMSAYRAFLAKLFSTRRKTIAKTLAREYAWHVNVKNALQEAGIQPDARVESLPAETILRLFEVLFPGV